MFDTKAPKIIYFTADAQPTPEEAMDMLNYGTDVQVRNARYIGENDGREECDGVAGAIPNIYSMAPSGADALEAYKAKVKARMALVGDSPAPEAAQPRAVRLMGTRTAPGPEALTELPAVPVLAGANADTTSHPDSTAPAAATDDSTVTTSVDSTVNADTASADPVDPVAAPVEVPAPVAATGKTKAAAAGWAKGK